LSDVIDFRPDKMADGSFSPNIMPSDNSVNYITVQRYLPRTDKIVLSRNKTFKLVSGTPDISAPTPPDDANSMTLYTLNYAPYTNTKEDVAVRVQNNKRYTMEDIGILEKRIDAVEYYTSLNLLEQEAKNTVIEDADGNVVPKKGILVDQFRGHNVADVKNTMFNAAIDPQNTVLRPAFRSKIYRVDVDTRAPASSLILPNVSSSLPGATADRLYTIEYTEVPGIIQPLATTSRQLNPYGIFNFMGSLKTYPDSDFWMSDTQSPSVRVNISGENDNWSYSVRGNVGAEGGTGAGQIGGVLALGTNASRTGGITIGAFSCPITVNGLPTFANGITSTGLVTANGGITVTGTATFNSCPTAPDPIVGNEVATKGYVDTLIGNYSGNEIKNEKNLKLKNMEKGKRTKIENRMRNNKK
jgi:hypothetical protein